jgi:hypothetical protein
MKYVSRMGWCVVPSHVVVVSLAYKKKVEKTVQNGLVWRSWRADQLTQACVGAILQLLSVKCAPLSTPLNTHIDGASYGDNFEHSNKRAPGTQT